MTLTQDAVAGLVKRITSNAAFLERKGWSKSAVLEREAATALEQQAARIKLLESIVDSCCTVLGNMAMENEGAIFNRWPIHHEPLRGDARRLLERIYAALSAKEPT